MYQYLAKEAVSDEKFDNIHQQRQQFRGKLEALLRERIANAKVMCKSQIPDLGEINARCN